MADLTAIMGEGFAALVDELPAERSRDERAAWAVGYLYSLAAAACPTEIRLIRDNVLGTVFEVDEAEKKVGYVVLRVEGRVVPVRVYER